MFRPKADEVEHVIDLMFQALPRRDLLFAFLNIWDIHHVYADLDSRVKLRAKKRSRNILSRGLRRIIIKKLDQDKCIYCGSELSDFDFEIDHFLAVNEALRHGGEIIDNLYNLFTSCKLCNRQKHDTKYGFMYDKVLENRKDHLYSLINDLWLSKRGRRLLKKMFLTHEEILKEWENECASEENEEGISEDEAMGSSGNMARTDAKPDESN